MSGDWQTGTVSAKAAPSALESALFQGKPLDAPALLARSRSSLRRGTHPHHLPTGAHALTALANDECKRIFCGDLDRRKLLAALAFALAAMAAMAASPS